MFTGVSKLGGQIVKLFEWFGDLASFLGQLVWRAVTPPYEFRELIRQFDSIGAMSLPLRPRTVRVDRHIAKIVS